jgi:NADH dehydrogenase
LDAVAHPSNVESMTAALVKAADWNLAMRDWPHVVIVGGGFGGLKAAKVLGKAKVRVTLIDRRNHHLFQPLLYQVATAALNPSDIAHPIRAVVRKQKNTRVLLGEARRIDTARRRIELDAGHLGYDYLILATGATHSYFGKDQWAGLAPGLKTVEDATEIRRRIFLAYEAAERESDPRKQLDWLTFVVVGGGATGVELAGALAEIGTQTLVNDFRSIDPRKVRVLLLEGQPRILPGFPEKLSTAAQRSLEKMKVEVRTGTLMTEIDGEGVRVKTVTGSERIATHTVLWAAGVQASPLARTLDAPLDRQGRVQVLPDCSVPGHPEVFVIGDLATMTSEGKVVPGVAQGALQSGEHVARIIRAELAPQSDGRTKPDVAARPAFRYKDKGSMATIGRSKAVVDLGRLKFSGFFAWMMWWAIHIMFLIGFRNRVMVIFSWAWSWLTFQRGARLITGEIPALPPVTIGVVEPENGLPVSARAIELLPPEMDGEDEAARHPLH